jgi:hypothetical protein
MNQLEEMDKARHMEYRRKGSPQLTYPLGIPHSRNLDVFSFMITVLLSFHGIFTT